MLHHFRHCTHTLAPPHLVETLCAGESCSEESGREIGRDDSVLLPFPRGPLRGPVFLRFPCNQGCCARAPYSSARLFQRVCKRCPYRLGPASASRRPLQLHWHCPRPDEGVDEQIAEFFFREKLPSEGFALQETWHMHGARRGRIAGPTAPSARFAAGKPGPKSWFEARTGCLAARAPGCAVRNAEPLRVGEQDALGVLRSRRSRAGRGRWWGHGAAAK